MNYNIFNSKVYSKGFMVRISYFFSTLGVLLFLIPSCAKAIDSFDFNGLSPEIQFHVIRQMKPHDRLTMRRASKQHKMMVEDETLWKHHLTPTEQEIAQYDGLSSLKAFFQNQRDPIVWVITDHLESTPSQLHVNFFDIRNSYLLFYHIVRVLESSHGKTHVLRQSMIPEKVKEICDSIFISFCGESIKTDPNSKLAYASRTIIESTVSFGLGQIPMFTVVTLEKTGETQTTFTAVRLNDHPEYPIDRSIRRITVPIYRQRLAFNSLSNPTPKLKDKQTTIP